MAYENNSTVTKIDITTGEKDGKGWTKAQIITSYKDGNYDQIGVFEAFNKDFIDTLKVGDNVNIHFNIKGKEYNGKYYTSNMIWKIDVLSKGEYVSKAELLPTTSDFKEDNSDLPF